MTERFSRPVFVTKPLLPPLSELTAGLERIYESGVVTNMGPLHQQLEARLHAHLGGEEFVLFNNGTIALMAALAALDLPPKSEVITTPFSFAATSHAIAALGLTPVFADIDPVYMTLDPASVARAITPATSCILAVHVYGYPCAVEALEALAAEHDLKLVYDAAHAFGLKLGTRKIAEYGDASVFSFHATKLYNSIEGGGVSINRQGAGKRLRDYRNFGIQNEERVSQVGINGKMSELHALAGLLNLDQIQAEMAKRDQVRRTYDEILSTSDGVILAPPVEGLTRSLQYYPIRLPRGREYVYDTLKTYNVFSRRYFYPLIADFDCYRSLPSAEGLPHARRAAKEVLCLPFSGDLADGTAAAIANLLLEILGELPQDES